MSRAELMQVETVMARLPGWASARGGAAIRRTLKFASFADAFAFMTRVAFEAERLNHHPDWFHSYRRVQVLLTTHSSGGLTELDVKLAMAIDEIAAALGAN